MVCLSGMPFLGFSIAKGERCTLPGGTIEEGESSTQAAARELNKEWIILVNPETFQEEKLANLRSTLFCPGRPKEREDR